MTIYDKLKSMRNQEMRGGDRARLDCVRWLLGCLDQLPRQPVSDVDAEKLLGGLVSGETKGLTTNEVEFIRSLLPKQLTEQEISDILEKHREEIMKISSEGGRMGYCTKVALKGCRYSGSLVKDVMNKMTHG